MHATAEKTPQTKGMNFLIIASSRCTVLLLLLMSSRGIWAISADDENALSLSLEEFHDLDDHSTKTELVGISGADFGEVEVSDGTNSIENDLASHHNEIESVPEKPLQQSHKSHQSNTIFDRFSRTISREIMSRFQLPHQLRPPTFPFQPLWDKRRGKSKDVLIAETGRSKYPATDIENVKRIGAVCPPDNEGGVESESEKVASFDNHDDDDESLAVCEPDSAQAVSCKVIDDAMYENPDHANDEIQAGMIVYVLPPSETFDENDFATDSIPDDERVDTSVSTLSEQDGESYADKPQIASSRCIVEMGKRYDANEEVIQYALIRRELHELGNVDVHRKDFAYQPVVINKPSTFATNHAHTGWEGGDFSVETRITPESEAVEVLSTYDPGYYSSDSAGRSDHDQQVSFRWWSWIDHFNQFFRHGNHGFNNDVDESSYDSGAVIPGSHHNYGQPVYGGNLYEEEGKQAFAGGSHGDIWMAKRRCPNKRVECDDKKEYIVKRLKIELGFPVLEAGLREVYFGELLAREASSSNLVTSYVDHFFREGKKGQVELWIVFENAGPSLRSYLYTSVLDSDGGFSVFQHSYLWRRLRKSIGNGKDETDLVLDIIRPKTSLRDQVADEYTKENDTLDHRQENFHSRKHAMPEGRQLLKDVLKQILTSVAFLHERGIVHRDIKPSRIEAVDCVLGDFSSAWDEYSKRNLYANGPSIKELTEEYAPPEVLLQQQGASWSPFSIQNPFSYDSWSIGVVALELLLGTPNVFSVDQRTTVILTHKLRKEGASSEDIQRALYLAALSQFCIYVPSQGKGWPLRDGDPMHNAKVVKESCTLRDFHNALRSRDPLGTGFNRSVDMLLHLIWKLLAWNPLDRLAPSQALLHPYFTSTANEPVYDLLNERLVLNNAFPYNSPFSGFHNALESQLLDPDTDVNYHIAVTLFTCPKCGKNYTDYNSCHKHARSRKHALFCDYDRSNLPHCINAHTMLPTLDRYGYCDIQGRRQTVEDFHSVHLFYDKQFYGIFDGHMGNLASKYAASTFYRKVEARLSNIDQIMFTVPNWKELVQADVEQSFEEIHEGIVRAVTSSPGGIMDESGTTATILYVTHLAIVIANVGDSRAVISQWKKNSKGLDTISAYQLTVDHTASSPGEQKLISDRGGSVSRSGGIERVNGILAVTRSLGDVRLAKYLSRTPYVLSLTKPEAREMCDSSSHDERESSHPCFIILASDGLWDVMNNQEAVEMVLEAMNTNEGSAFQIAAEWLTQEAYVRGSSDNIGVCVVEIV